jgi:proteasome beta subunit
MNTELKDNIIHTGTSLVGIVCKDGVVMAGDRKSTLGGSIVFTKDTQKVDPINDYLVISGTGMSSDIELSKKIIRAQLKLKELRDKKRPTIGEAANMIAMMSYRNIRQPSMIPFMAGLMVGGINLDKTVELYSVEPAGSVRKIKKFDANLSSGMPYILGMLETNYKDNMGLNEAIELATKAIQSASERDTGSGYGVDVFAITKDGIKHVSKKKGEWKYTEE